MGDIPEVGCWMTHLYYFNIAGLSTLSFTGSPGVLQHPHAHSHLLLGSYRGSQVLAHCGWDSMRFDELMDHFAFL